MLNIGFTAKGKHILNKSVIANIGRGRKVFNYFFAISVCILGFLIKLYLIRTLHYPEGGFLISLGTIMVSAWYGGLGPGIVAVLFNYLIIDWFFITPKKLFFNDTFVDQFRFILFLAEGIMISWLFESLHKAHQKTRTSLFMISQNEKRYRSLIENVKDHAIFMVDAKGKILTWNEGATIMTGYQADEILFQPLSILDSIKTRKGYYNKDLQLALANGQYNREGWKMRKGESLFWAETVITALPYISPKDQKYSVIIHDTTSRKKTDELKSELLSIITHELRTPIAIMKVIIENLVAEYSQKKGYSNEIRDLLDLNGEVDRLTLLIENIVDLTRLRRKKFILHKQDINLSLLIKRIVSKMQLIAGEKRSTIICFSGNIAVSADQLKIEQVLMNLLDNAIKYSPVGGKIEVTAKVVKNMVIVSIMNETEEEIPRDKYLLIFDKFYQLTKTPVKGLGLGLYISREIIKQHRGKLWISSHVGKGNIFSFSLPAK